MTTKTEFHKFIRDKFGTIQECADAIGCTRQTLTRLMKYPAEITIGRFSQICIKSNTTGTELFTILQKSINEQSAKSNRTRAGKQKARRN